MCAYILYLMSTDNKLLRVCGWMCTLIVLKTNRDDRWFFQRRGRLQPHTLTGTWGLWIEGGLQLAFCSFVLLFFFPLSWRWCASKNSQRHLHFEVRLLNREVERDLAKSVLLQCRGETRLQGLQICSASAWFSCYFFLHFFLLSVWGLKL